MSDASTPKTWWEAMSSHVVWGSLVFTCFLVFVEKLIEQHYGQALAAFLLGLGIAAVSLHSKAWLERTNPNLAFAGAALCIMAVLSFPFVEQHRWPYQDAISKPPPQTVAVATPNTPIAMADPVAGRKLVTGAQLLDKVDALQSQVDKTTKELEATKRQLADAQHSGVTSMFPPTQTEKGSITWEDDSQFLVVTGGGPDATINSVLIQGTSTNSVAIKEAYAISGLTGHRQELMANVQYRGYYAVDKVDIPPKAPVWLELIFKPALPTRDFLDQWGKFHITVSYNGMTYEREFDDSYIRRKLEQQNAGAFGPHVTPKEDK
jgi:hypothetical protein